MRDSLVLPHPDLRAILGQVVGIPPRVADSSAFADGELADSLAIAASHPSKCNIQHYLRSAQSSALWSSNPHIEGSSSSARKLKAYEKYHRVQRTNRISSKRIAFYRKHPLRMRPGIQRVISRARMELFQLLGPSPTYKDMQRFHAGTKVGPGVCLGLGPLRKGNPSGKRKGPVIKDTSLYGKLTDLTCLSYTPDLLSWFGRHLVTGAFGRRLRSLLAEGLPESVCEANRATTVPKTAVIDRVISVEPFLNGIVQQGIRAMLEHHLRRWDVHLDRWPDGTSGQVPNGLLARLGSIRGFSRNGYSTIDLSSASDTVTTELVSWLIPPGWFELMDAARSKKTEIEGVVYEFCGFSSMGNAFTFPLECLIFAALTRAAMHEYGSDQIYRVYGDDIVAPTNITAVLIETLLFCGFRPNGQKTHVTGFFRESCGQDWILGENVRPVFLKDRLGHPTEVYSFYNRLQSRYVHHELMEHLLGMVRDPYIGPETSPSGGDLGHFVVSWDTLASHSMVRWNSRFWRRECTYYTWIVKPRRRRKSIEENRLLSALVGDFTPHHSLRRNSFSVRDRQKVPLQGPSYPVSWLLLPW